MPGHSNRIVLAGGESACHRRLALVAVDFERSGCKLHRNGATKPLYSGIEQAGISRQRSDAARRSCVRAGDSTYPLAGSISLGQNPQLQGCDAAHLARAGRPAAVRTPAAAARSPLLVRRLPATSCGRRCSCAKPCAATAVDLGLHPREHTALAPLAAGAPRKIGGLRPTNASDGRPPVSCPFPLETSP